MAIGMREPKAVASARDLAMAGGYSNRGFWTKRRRTAGSLMAIIGLMAGIAVAYKLFDKTVPNNVVRDASHFDYEIQAYDTAAGESAYRAVTGFEDKVIFRQSLSSSGCAGEQPPAVAYPQPNNDTNQYCNVDSFPGDSRTSMVKIKNTNAAPAKDASFDVYVKQSTILVARYDVDKDGDGIFDPGTGETDFDNDGITDEYHAVPASNPDYTTFLNYWTMSVKKQTYFKQSPFTAGSGEYENSPTSNSSYADTNCVGLTLTSITPQNPCKLGIIKAAGSQGVGVLSPVPTGFPARPIDDREYKFTMSELETGSDQSAYLGWRVVFDLVVNARVSAEAETGRYSQIPS